MSASLALALLLAVLIGVSLGTLGSGGSIITMPVLVYVAGIPAHAAVAMSLVVVGTTAAAGSYLQSRSGGFHRRAAAIFAATGVGRRLRWRQAHAPGDRRHADGDLRRAHAAGRLENAGGWRAGRARAGACSVPRCAGVGLAVGVLTGFLGIGGGFLILPALVFAAGLDMKRAVPTSLAVIAFNSAGGLAGQLRYVSFDWPLTAAFLASALAGMVGGSMLTQADVGPGPPARLCLGRDRPRRRDPDVAGHGPDWPPVKVRWKASSPKPVWRRRAPCVGFSWRP